jgi:hypothetical protein
VKLIEPQKHGDTKAHKGFSLRTLLPLQPLRENITAKEIQNIVPGYLNLFIIGLPMLLPHR